MNYLTEYYKNVCNQLQEKLNLLEANYLRAIRSGNPDLLRHQLMVQQLRSLQATDQKDTMRALAQEMGKLAQSYPEWERLQGTTQIQTGKQGAKEAEHEENIQAILQALAPIIGNKWENPDEFAAARQQQQSIDAETMQAVNRALARMASGNQQVQITPSQGQY